MSNPPYDIDLLFDEVITLPSLPSTITRIMQMVNDPNCALSDVAKVIATDPPLAAKTLRLVNTAYYGLRQKVSSIEHAVVMLGVKVIKNLVFTATVFDSLKDEEGTYFRHSIACGLAMRALSEASLPPLTDDAFVYGLLHDIGKIVLQTFLPKEYASIEALMHERRLSAYQAEQEVLGVDHAQVGARLATTWKLADSLVQAIGAHHDLGMCEDPQFEHAAALISIADYICWQCGIAPGPIVPHVDEAVWTAGGISSTSIPNVLEKFFSELPMVDELMQISA